MKAVVPDPSKMLPSEGLIQVMAAAAAENPVLTILATLAFLAFVFGMACWTAREIARLFVLRNENAAKALRAIERDENAMRAAIKSAKGKKKLKDRSATRAASQAGVAK